ncbi:MAG TPA: glycosyltransferase family 2 protein [bacterium]|nr:glycosyltransferase family 2 protein [bacterium]
MTPPYAISVIVPTRQRREAVRRLLAALGRQTLAADRFEVIVSVDGSNDGTSEMLDQLPTSYALRRVFQPHGGRAAACNAGVRAAQGETVVLLDDDMAPVPECLSAHLCAHAAHPRTGVLGAVPVEIGESVPPVAAYIADRFGRHLAKISAPGYSFQVRDFYSGNFSIRRDLLVDVGLFDEAFTIYGNEDIDLWLRLARAGVGLRYSAAAIAYQCYSKTFADLARDTIAKGRTSVLLATKHPQAFSGLRLATLHSASPRWRVARGALVSLSLWCPAVPVGVMRVVTVAERRRPRHLRRIYDFALDYFYWLGAYQALHEGGLRQLLGSIQQTPRGRRASTASFGPSKSARGRSGGG